MLIQGGKGAEVGATFGAGASHLIRGARDERLEGEARLEATVELAALRWLGLGCGRGELALDARAVGSRCDRDVDVDVFAQDLEERIAKQRQIPGVNPSAGELGFDREGQPPALEVDGARPVERELIRCGVDRIAEALAHLVPNRVQGLRGSVREHPGHASF